MNWFIAWATSPSAPYLLIAAVALIFAAVVLLVRSWLDRQETKSLADYRGHVPPRPWPDPADTHPASVPQKFHNTKPPERNDCCGACDGSRCGDKPMTASMMTPTQLREALGRAGSVRMVATQARTGQVPPRRNPGHVPPRPMPAPAVSASPARRRDDDDEPYRGSYYGQAVSQVMDSEAPAPAFRSGRGGDFGGAGASGSWDEPVRSSSSTSSHSYSSGCSSDSSSSSGSDSGSSSSCGGSD
jgi:hypothetical protein